MGWCGYSSQREQRQEGQTGVMYLKMLSECIVVGVLDVHGGSLGRKVGRVRWDHIVHRVLTLTELGPNGQWGGLSSLWQALC